MEEEVWEGGKLGRAKGLGREGRERRGSTGMVEVPKRKRDIQEWLEGAEGRRKAEEEGGFKRSKKTLRSPVGKGEEEDAGMMEVLKGWMEEMKGRWEKMEERMEDRMDMIMGELESMRGREEEWRKEKEGMEKRIEELEKKWEENMSLKDKGKGAEGLEERVRRLEEGERKGEKREEGGGKGMEERVRRMEWTWERKERQERKRNVVVKGIKGEGKEVRNVVGEILKQIGAEVKVEEVRAVRAGREDWGGMVVVRLETEEEKREVMKRKKGLKGGTVWIEEDLTWRERRSRWRFREAVRAKEQKGVRVWVGVNRAMINGEWWLWDEEEEVLRKGRNDKKEENDKSSGEEKGGV